MPLSPSRSDREFQRFFEDANGEPVVRSQAGFYLKLTDRVNSALSYVGVAPHGANTSDAVWQIKRIIVSGSITREEYANEGAFNQVWDDRGTIFTDGALTSTLSTAFDGINDLVNFGDDFTYFDVGNQWSMSFWVKIDNLAAQRCIYSKATNDVNVYGLNIQVTTAGKVFIQLRSASYGVNYVGLITVPTNQWAHIVITYAGGSNANGMKVYVDAVLDTLPGSAALSVSLYSGQNAIIGSRNTSFPFSGNIFGVSFWSKALSSTEITELFTGGSALSPQDHSAAAFLLNWMRMGDNDTYPTIADSVGSAVGTMTNMTSDDFVADVP